MSSESSKSQAISVQVLNQCAVTAAVATVCWPSYINSDRLNTRPLCALIALHTK